MPFQNNADVDVSRETKNALEIYRQLLLKWQSKINLISNTTKNHIWERHFIDSLQLRRLIRRGTNTFIDIGSGGGLPAIPLCLATGKHATLVESDHRKVVFLEEVRRTLELPVQITCSRIEALQPSSHKLITSRACAPLSKLLDYAAPHLSPDGQCLFPKGRQYGKEIEEARRFWTFDCQITPSQTAPEAAILMITQLAKRM